MLCHIFCKQCHLFVEIEYSDHICQTSSQETIHFTIKLMTYHFCKSYYIFVEIERGDDMCQTGADADW